MPRKNPSERSRYSKDQRSERKAGGLCVECGGQRDDDGRLVRCSRCRDSHRAVSRASAEKRRLYFREAGLCQDCGKVPPRKGYTCGECAAFRRSAQRTWTEKARRRLEETGLCQLCGKTPARSSLTYCEGCTARRKERYAVHRDRRVADHKVARQVLKRLVLEAYGGAKCACCGESRVEFLSIDHVAGDGAAHRRELFGRNHGAGSIYAWLKKTGFPSGYRVLCINCNFAIGQRGSCPHERERLQAVPGLD